MDINQIIVDIMVVFMVIGGLDRILGNRWGYGEKFEEGFMAMGSLALAMLGIMSLAPVLASILEPVIVPIYAALGADPAMFATTFLANDMGGYPLAMQLAQTEEAGLFAGLILGSMMGPTIVFTIPVALGIIKKEDHAALATGILAGIITIPLGCIVGGLVAGYSLSFILSNLTPIVIISLLIVLGLWRIPDKIIAGFKKFGAFVVILITIGLIAIIIETLTGIVVIPGMAPIWDGIETIGSITIMLAGAFPLVHFLTTVFKKPLMSAGKLLGVNEIAAAGLVTTLANNIPMFQILKDMDERGKILNVAFAVSAAFTFGDHLGFTAGVAREMIFPVIVGKLVAGITALMVAMLFAPKKESSMPAEIKN